MPKYRAWISEADTMTNNLKGIDFENETVVLKKFYWEDGFPVEEEVFEVEIGNAIIMQSTGLTDKNGKEIFEGDILHHQIQTEYTFIVKYDKDNARWYGDGLSRTYRIDIMKDFLQYYKVIGNIYENPELLEEKK